MTEWHRIEEMLPEYGKIVYVYGKYIEGLYVLNNDQWYSLDEVKSDDEYFESAGYDLDAVIAWREKPQVPEDYTR